MKIKEEHTKTSTYDITVGFVCDKCGKKFKSRPGKSVSDFSLECDVGGGTADGGGYIETRYVNLCEDCIEWLFETLESCGVKINTEESDW